MSILSKAVDRLANFFRFDHKVILRFAVDRYNAPYVVPLIEKLIADGEDGDTYRSALAAWNRAERPPIALYDGETSFCRIDGPYQWAGNHVFPLGGLVLSSGVTAHLDPYQASDLHFQMRAAIERAIQAWVADNGLRECPMTPVAFDREAADRKAKTMIAARGDIFDQDRMVAAARKEGSDHV
ncbi:MAG: hypothetical protein WA940_06220 [Sphingopyxis sp.]